MSTGSNRRISPRYVWVGIHVPAPDNPPRSQRIEKVFANEEDAREWELEGPLPNVNSAYRTVQRHEVADS